MIVALFYFPLLVGVDKRNSFFSKIGRLAAPDYQPSDVDIIKVRSKNTNMTETPLQMGAIRIKMFDIGNQGIEPKCFHYFDCITSVVFVVDLDTYDQVSSENQPQNKLMESLGLFESVVNSRWFTDTSIILLFSNVTKFKLKLSRSPLGTHFPDYSGGDDVNSAAKYIVWRFNQVNRKNLILYPQITDSSNTINVRLVFSALKETLLNNTLKQVPTGSMDT